jgi:hypothetical protein
MRYCEKCQVKLANDYPECPLCGEITEKSDEVFSQDYPSYNRHPNARLVKKAFFLASILLCVGSGVLNLIYPQPVIWSLIVLLAVLYAWLVYFCFMRRRRNIAFLGMALTLGASVCLFFFDFLTGFQKWSTNYAIPIMIGAGVLYCTIVILAAPKRFHDYAVSLLILVFFGMLMMLLRAVGLSDIIWPAAAATAVSVAILLTLFIFYNRKTLEEIKRRLRF